MSKRFQINPRRRLNAPTESNREAVRARSRRREADYGNVPIETNRAAVKAAARPPVIDWSRYADDLLLGFLIFSNVVVWGVALYRIYVFFRGM